MCGFIAIFYRGVDHYLASILLDFSQHSRLAGYKLSECECLTEDLIKVFTIYYQSATGYPMLNKLKEHWYFTNEGVHTVHRPLKLESKHNDTYDVHLGDYHIVVS